jgi:hypothetical protein
MIYNQLMLKDFLCFLLIVLFAGKVFSQFSPPAGQTGSTAIFKDSSVFVSWATGCIIKRGLQNISDSTSGYSSSGDSSMVIGKAGENGVVSLGDGGSAILTFSTPLINGNGWDFAVFENSFSDSFLELAFVEVSSDGINYFRFHTTSLTQDTIQIDTYGSVSAEQINNLAGKYKALYGTPFDLEELKNENGLDVNDIKFVKIIDVVGCIQVPYCSYDFYGNKINDPWPTSFAGGGFDLDAIGVIHHVSNSVENDIYNDNLIIFPNPVFKNGTIHINYNNYSSRDLELIINDISGKIITGCLLNNHQWKLNTNGLQAGVYFFHFNSQNLNLVKKVVILN